MKTSRILRHSTALAVAFTLGSLFAPSPALRAHEGEDHKHAPATATSASVSDAWKTAQAALKAIETAAAAKESEPIHHEQERLAAALKQIQESHGAQGADKARIEGALKNAITASDKVHAAADAKDFAKVDASLKTLQSTMALLEKQLK